MWGGNCDSNAGEKEDRTAEAEEAQTERDFVIEARQTQNIPDSIPKPHQKHDLRPELCQNGVQKRNLQKQSSNNLTVLQIESWSNSKLC